MVFQRNLKPNDKIEARLLLLAGTFVSIYTLALILAPAVRARSWGVDYPWTYSFGLLAWIFVFSLAHLRLSYVLPGRDPFILPMAALLSGWGLFNIWRLVPVLGMRQSVWVLISGLVLVLGLSASSDLGFLRRYKYLWLVGSLTLTAATLILGTNPLGYGPRMWLGCCGLYMQPSEPLKLLFITYLAAYMADREPYLALTRLRLPGRARTEPWPSFSTPLLPIIAPTLIVIGLALTLLVVQRDLGTASIFFLLYAAVLFSASGQKRILGATALALVFAAVAGYLTFDVVRLRVDAWLNPWLDPSGRSYQVVQSLISIAAGGLFGRGPGVGNPGLVPVAHSDLIYATIVEESGLVGAIALLAVLALLTARGLTISLRAANSYHRYLAVGLTLYLVGQSLLIISGSLRLLPLTGVTLPFVSYGGSSLLTSFLSITILLHISHYSSEAKVPSLAPGTSKNYLQIGLFLFMGLIAAALATGWWSIYRASNLLARTDNARRSIADRSVMRGSLLDRHGDPIQVTVGKPGEYARLSLYPDLGNVVGYTSPVYGQSGLEASLDSSLRGISGNPIASIWWKGLLYGQPPPGLDMRLTLDLELQETADDLLADHRGALIIMDARRGDILVMASHPTIDPNNLEEDWERLVEDPDSPFINRATGGQYAPGAALGPLLYAKVIDEGGELPGLPSVMSYSTGDREIECAHSHYPGGWPEAISDGCPGALAALGERLGVDRVRDYYQSLGLYTQPALRMPVAEVASPEAVVDNTSAVALGEGLHVSPLQLARAAAILSADGVLPAPIIAEAYDSTEVGWKALAPLDSPRQVLAGGVASQAGRELALNDEYYWQSVSVAPFGADEALTWYLAGTVESTNGNAYLLVLILEEKAPDLALEIGRTMIDHLVSP